MRTAGLRRDPLGMKLVAGIVVGLVLGMAASPRAANENETLSLLCKRFGDGAGGAKLTAAMKRIEGKGASEADVAIAGALSSVRDMVCVGR